MRVQIGRFTAGLEHDLFEDRFLAFNGDGCHARVFLRAWPHWKPFAFRRYGLMGCGALFLGVNVWRFHA